MPPVVIAAGIATAGAVGSAVVGSKAAKKAAKASQNATNQTIAAQTANRDYQYNLNAPTITQGQGASGTIAALLGLGGDQAAAEKGLATFRSSTGYGDLVREGLAGVNANAYARGMGQSGAAYKALQDRATQIANASGQQYIGNLNTLASRGDQARGLVAGVGLNTVNSTTNALINNATNQGNAALTQGANQSQLLQNLANIGASAYGSSYGGGGGAYGIRGSQGIY